MKNEIEPKYWMTIAYSYYSQTAYWDTHSILGNAPGHQKMWTFSKAYSSIYWTQHGVLAQSNSWFQLWIVLFLLITFFWNLVLNKCFCEKKKTWDNQYETRKWKYSVLFWYLRSCAMPNKCTICYKKVIELLEKEVKSFFLSIYVYYYCQMATKFFG